MINEHLNNLKKKCDSQHFTDKYGFKVNIFFSDSYIMKQRVIKCVETSRVLNRYPMKKKKKRESG